MRIGTWNLRLCPASESATGQALAGWMHRQGAAIWLLTEVHRDWVPLEGRLLVSPVRSASEEWKRWAGIETVLPVKEAVLSEADHAGDEGLCLARLEFPGGPTSSVLVACSVLPWKGAGKYWAGLPAGQFEEWRHVLDRHVERIGEARIEGEPLIWGGDFNQPLTGPFSGATRKGADYLRDAFRGLGLIALTEDAEHLNGTSRAIDHLALSAELVVEGTVATVHRPLRNGKNLSDHAGYTADLAP